ncbi:hypothetical protein ABPG74_019989 [Tetrahymena malaccensis]
MAQSEEPGNENLRGNYLGDNGLKKFNSAIQCLPKLSVLHLGLIANEINNPGLQDLSSTFLNLKNLSILSLELGQLGLAFNCIKEVQMKYNQLAIIIIELTSQLIQSNQKHKTNKRENYSIFIKF